MKGSVRWGSEDMLKYRRKKKGWRGKVGGVGEVKYERRWFEPFFVGTQRLF